MANMSCVNMYKWPIFKNKFLWPKVLYFFVHLSCSLNDEVIDDLIVEGFYIPNIGRLYIPVMEDFTYQSW